MIAKTDDFTKIKKISLSIFHKELGLSENDIFDNDDAFLVQFLILDGKIPVGTFRLRSVGNSHKIERMGILYEYRSQGLGESSLTEIKSLSKKSGKKQIILDSIYTVNDFYAKSGFVTPATFTAKLGFPISKWHLILIEKNQLSLCLE